MLPEILAGLTNNAAYLLALWAIYGLVKTQGKSLKPGLEKFLVGLIVGAIGLAVMRNPLPFAPGVVFDTRSILLSVSGLFFGFIPTAIAVIITGAYRLVEGGTGALTGIGVILCSAGIGLAWRYGLRLRRQEIGARGLYLLGLVVHMVMLLMMFTLPLEIASNVLRQISLPVLIIYPVATTLVGLLFINDGARRTLAQQLGESEEQFRTAFEYSASGMCLTSLDGTLLRVNQAMVELFGDSKETLQRKHFNDITHPDDVEIGRDVVRQMMSGQVPSVSFEKRYVRNGGEPFWAHVTSAVLRDSSGRPLHFITEIEDITERIQAEEAVKESEARFKAVAEFSPLAVYASSGSEQKAEYINPAFYEVFGYTIEDVPTVGAWWIKAFPDETYRQWVMAKWQKNIDDAEKHNTSVAALECVCACKDGSQKVISWEGKNIGDQFFAFGLDLTKRKQTEDAIRQLNETLEQRIAERTSELAIARDRAESADRLKSAFLATMSHELRTPLNSIVGFTGIILQEMAGPLNPEQHKQMGMVQNSARHLLALINDVLDISKIEAGQLEIRHSPFDLTHVIEGVDKTFLPLAQKKGLTLVIHIDPKIGQIVSDQRRVEQILINLIGNAIKFTDTGRITLEAALVSAPTPAVRIQVTDTGIGITPEDMKTLFTPFQQLDTGIARLREGTGLGLSICRKLVELLGGEIWGHSEGEGTGSTFGFWLPLEKE